jgi:hypothetical protein
VDPTRTHRAAGQNLVPRSPGRASWGRCRSPVRRDLDAGRAHGGDARWPPIPGPGRCSRHRGNLYRSTTPAGAAPGAGFPCGNEPRRRGGGPARHDLRGLLVGGGPGGGVPAATTADARSASCRTSRARRCAPAWPLRSGYPGGRHHDRYLPLPGRGPLLDADQPHGRCRDQEPRLDRCRSRGPGHDLRGDLAPPLEDDGRRTLLAVHPCRDDRRLGRDDLDRRPTLAADRLRDRVQRDLPVCGRRGALDQGPGDSLEQPAHPGLRPGSRAARHLLCRHYRGLLGLRERHRVVAPRHGQGPGGERGPVPARRGGPSGHRRGGRPQERRARPQPPGVERRLFGAFRFRIVRRSPGAGARRCSGTGGTEECSPQPRRRDRGKTRPRLEGREALAIDVLPSGAVLAGADSELFPPAAPVRLASPRHLDWRDRDQPRATDGRAPESVFLAASSKVCSAARTRPHLAGPEPEAGRCCLGGGPPAEPGLALAASAFGVFRTSDFGATWTLVSEPLGRSSAHAIRFLPGNDQVVFATTSQGLYRSADQGRTWMPRGGGLPLLDITGLHFTRMDAPPCQRFQGRGVAQQRRADLNPLGRGLLTERIWALAVDPRGPAVLAAPPPAACSNDAALGRRSRGFAVGYG